MNILFISVILIASLYYFTYRYKERFDDFLKSMNLTTFDAIWLAYIEGFIIGGLLMTIIS